MYNFSRNLSNNKPVDYYDIKPIKKFNERPAQEKKKDEVKIDKEKQKKKIHSIIPLNIFQTWHTLDLPPKMQENVELLKAQNTEFTHYLYDDEMCREFISIFF